MHKYNPFWAVFQHRILNKNVPKQGSLFYITFEEACSGRVPVIALGCPLLPIPSGLATGKSWAKVIDGRRSYLKFTDESAGSRRQAACADHRHLRIVRDARLPAPEPRLRRRRESRRQAGGADRNGELRASGNVRVARQSLRAERPRRARHDEARAGVTRKGERAQMRPPPLRPGAPGG